MLRPSSTAKRLERAVNELRHERRLTVAQLIDITGRNPRHPGTQARSATLIGASCGSSTCVLVWRTLSCSLHNDATGCRSRRINVELVATAWMPISRSTGLVVELDGGVEHGSNWRPAFEADRAQMVDVLLATGLPTIRFTRDQVLRHERLTAAKLAGILRMRVEPTVGAEGTRASGSRHAGTAHRPDPLSHAG